MNVTALLLMRVHARRHMARTRMHMKSCSTTFHHVPDVYPRQAYNTMPCLPRRAAVGLLREGVGMVSRAEHFPYPVCERRSRTVV